jgi:nitrate/nitrite-specific signal transduction histidine kinase
MNKKQTQLIEMSQYKEYQALKMKILEKSKELEEIERRITILKQTSTFLHTPINVRILEEIPN